MSCENENCIYMIKKLKEELVISKSQYEYERERAIMTLKKIEESDRKRIDLYIETRNYNTQLLIKIDLLENEIKLLKNKNI